MNRTLLLAAAAALMMSAGGAASAAVPLKSNISMMGGKVQFPGRVGGLAVLYKQTEKNSGIGIVSQKFEPTYGAYDSQAADDFTVPAGKTWKVKVVIVSGEYFNGSGPATSENVTFYAMKKGLPSTVVKKFIGVKGKDSDGSFTITLPHRVKLPAGTYFLSVQANLAFAQGGEWGWNTTDEGDKTQGNPAAWENPDGGFGTDCATYEVETTCVPDGQGPDHVFELLGER